MGLPIGAANYFEEKGDPSFTQAINLEAQTMLNTDPLESKFDKWQNKLSTHR